MPILPRLMTEIDEDLKRDILGARRKMLFVEGVEGSLDMPLYSIVFPNVSVIPKGSTREVESVVSAIRNTGQPTLASCLWGCR